MSLIERGRLGRGKGGTRREEGRGEGSKRDGVAGR